MIRTLRQTRRWLLDRSVHVDMSLRWARARLRTLRNGTAHHALIPRGFHHSTVDWYQSLSATKKSRTLLTNVYPAETIDLVPVTNGPPDQRLTSHATLDCPAMFVVGIENGRMLDTTGEVVAPDGKVLADLSLMYPDHVQPWVKDLHRPFAMTESPATVAALGRACVLTTQYGSRNYFHWMLNALPRVHLYQQAGLDLDQIDTFVTNELQCDFQTESLQRAGVAMSKVVMSGEGFCGDSETLFSTRSLRSAGHRCSWALDYLRLLFRDSLEESAGSRLYITRRDAVSRRVVNEDDVIGYLDRHGFETVVLSDLAISEQAKRFSQASVVVAPHGAGLTNLAFCNPDTRVIEMLSPNYLKTYYWELASAMKLQYGYLIGECETAHDQAADYRVDVDVLADVLRKNGF